MTRRVWVRHPNAGGVKVPPAVRQRTEQRIRRYAEKHFAGEYTRLEIRFRAQFCYIDAYTEPSVPKGWPRRAGTRPGSSTSSGYATPRHTSVASGISATKNGGASPSSPTAARSTS